MLYLRECLPDAFYGKKAQMEPLLEQTEEQWYQTEAELAQQRAQREKDKNDFTKHQNTILRRADGSVTSRITLPLLRDTLEECQKSIEETFFLEATQPVLIDATAYLRWNVRLERRSVHRCGFCSHKHPKRGALHQRRECSCLPSRNKRCA